MSRTMARELPFRPGECDSCVFFRPDRPTLGKAVEAQDIGDCAHEFGPANAVTTRGPKPLPVATETRYASSGMTCDRYQPTAAVVDGAA